MKKLWIILTPCILLAAIVICFFVYFNNHFMPNTKINGQEVSYLNVDEAFDVVAKPSEDDVNLYENGELIDTFKIHDYVTINFDKNIVQNAFNDNKFKTADIICFFDKNINIEAISEKIGTLNIDRTKSEDAYVEFDSENFEYYIEEETYGNYLDVNNITNTVVENINHTINISLDEYYTPPTVFSDDEKLIEKAVELNKLYSAKIDYKLPDDEIYTFDKNVFGSWITFENEEVKFDEDKIDDFLNHLAELTNTVGMTRSFDTQNGTKDIIGGTYGWKLDKNAEKESIKHAILNHEIMTREPFFEQTAAVYSKKNDVGNTYIEVDIDNQHLYLIEEGKITFESDVVTGMLSNKGRHTTTGTHFIYQMDKSRYLNGPTWHTFVNRFMPFHGGEGFHDATWRSSFGGEIYKRDGSHGCVNMPKSKALELFDKVYVGIPVVIYSSEY